MVLGSGSAKRKPTLRGVSVYRRYRDYADGYGVTVKVVGNKVTGAADEAFLREHVGNDLLACFGTSGYVRAAEQDHVAVIEHLEATGRQVLDTLRAAVDARSKDWDTFQDQAVDFHLRNDRAWANNATGVDLAGQVDPGFVHGPQTVMTTPAISTMLHS